MFINNTLWLQMKDNNCISVTVILEVNY